MAPQHLPVLNVSAYLFSPLANLPARRDDVFARAHALGLKGTVLLAEEGINLFLAGRPDDVRALVAHLQADPALAALTPKDSWSDHVPFRKLLVKVKREIIRMDHPQVRPSAGRAPSVDARTLARWLDAGVDDRGRPVVMLDTRNAFEVDHGRFSGAIDWRIGKFTEFPAAVRAHAASLAGKTVVSYCTGGIRCEKAALFMADAGVADVLQLEGGILKYFEEAGGAHFEGGCFVFDERVALAPDLHALDPGATVTNPARPAPRSGTPG